MTSPENVVREWADKNPPLIEFSASSIGQIWGEDDHLRLVLTLRKIDQLVQQLHNMAAERAKEADQIIRVNEEALAR